MPSFKGKRNGAWTDASAVYGKSAGTWLYGKYALAKRNGVWERAWTDCRQHDAGGRDWTASAGVTEYQGSCSTRESRVRTDYTKTGCTSYSRYTAWVSSPDCGAVGGSCWTDVTCSYVGQSNVSFGGKVFDVVDIFGECTAVQQQEDCWYRLYTCGATQGLIQTVCF